MKTETKNLLIVLSIIPALGIVAVLAELDSLSKSPEQSSVATTPSPRASKKSVQSYIPQYQSVIGAIDKDHDIILNVRPGRTDGEINITISNAFFYQPYQVRLQVAQGLWKAWASVYSPEDPDKAYILITDSMNNEVGGSRAFAGSLIWVDDSN